MYLSDALHRMQRRRMDLSPSYFYVLSAALRWFGDRPIETATAEDVADMMLALRDAGRSVKTIRNYRQAILYLLAEAGVHIDPQLIRPPRNVRRLPTAWTLEQLSALIRACRAAPTRRGWGPSHWEALTLTIYDTSLRIGCLLRADMAHLDESTGTLYVPGEHHKGRDDTIQPLHADTVRLIVSLERHDSRMFPWPFTRRQIWKQFGEILTAAGLPSTRRDKFHRLRRTSYTYVARSHGVAVASEHAAHKTDLSSYYLDKRLIDRPNPLHSLPRPE